MVGLRIAAISKTYCNTYHYSSQFAPPSDSVHGSVTKYPDGGWFEYEADTGHWLVKGTKSMVIEARDNNTLKAA